MRTYLYKLTSDRGGAPCAPPPAPGADSFLTLAICKPAIRRTALPGDRILGITSHSLAHSDGYPLASVIYAAIVKENINSLEYFTPEFTHRPDCIYEFHRLNGEKDRAAHAGRSALHADDAHIRKDLGTYPLYRNGHVLFCQDFRYFGPAAVKIPARLHLLNQAAESLGQGHRVYTDRDPEQKELDTLFRHLWKRPTSFTPTHVESDAYDHTPKSRRPAKSCQAPKSVDNSKSPVATGYK